MPTRLAALTALALTGCISYYAAKKDDANTRTEEILLGSEVAVGVAFGTTMYMIIDKNERLPLAANIALGIGCALFADVLGAGVIAIVNCDSQDPQCKK